MDLGLDGRNVLVTGGAGGIGSAVVRAFASAGANVAVHYNTSADAAVALADEVGGSAIQADLTTEADADALVPEAVRILGSLDVCVANAGAWPSEDVPLWDLTLARWNHVIAANLTSVFLTVRSFLRHAADTGSGSIVMTGSTAGIFGEAGHADYAAAKGAILTGLLLSAKNEAARIGPDVRVNAVAPGWTVTPMIGEKGLDEAQVAKVTSTMALPKLGLPTDVAGAVVYLSSDVLAGHVTGQVITVAGGMEGRRLR